MYTWSRNGSRPLLQTSNFFGRGVLGRLSDVVVSQFGNVRWRGNAATAPIPERVEYQCILAPQVTPALARIGVIVVAQRDQLALPQPVDGVVPTTETSLVFLQGDALCNISNPSDVAALQALRHEANDPITDLGALTDERFATSQREHAVLAARSHAPIDREDISPYSVHASVSWSNALSHSDTPFCCEGTATNSCPRAALWRVPSSFQRSIEW